MGTSTMGTSAVRGKHTAWSIKVNAVYVFSGWVYASFITFFSVLVGIIIAQALLLFILLVEFLSATMGRLFHGGQLSPVVFVLIVAAFMVSFVGLWFIGYGVSRQGAST